MRINERSTAEHGVFPQESMTTSPGSPDDDSSLTTDSLPPLTAITIGDFAYRGEGNANVVIALPQEHKVIRFRKSLPEEVSQDGGRLRVERELEFVRSVVSCFLGSYAQIPEILRYDTKDIARLSEAIRSLRPEKRRHKEIAEVYATKMPDYTFLRASHGPDLFRNKSTFCVEIKPKQGYLRKTEQKFQKCPYCLTQYYKLKKRAITARSAYCPFDLFSGEQGRMKRALKGLLASPQNNLKIFKDGIVVYDQEASPSDLERVLAEWLRNQQAVPTLEGQVEKFCELVCSALLCPFAQERSRRNGSQAWNFLAAGRQDQTKTRSSMNQDVLAKARKLLYFAGEECNLKGDDLPKDSVLERILRMQRLPYVSAEYIYNTYSKYAGTLTDEAIYSNLIKSHGLYEYQSPYIETDTLVENSELLKEIYLRASGKGGSMSKKTKFKEDPNGNRHASPEPEWSSGNEAIENGAPVPKSALLLPTYLEQNNLHNNKTGLSCCNGDDFNQTTRPSIGYEAMLALQNYLLFSSARDCSILMAFQELNPNNVPSVLTEQVITLSDETSFVCNIGVSDLDPKSIHCIEKHRQRDIEILNAVISILEEELAMKNQSANENRLTQ